MYAPMRHWCVSKGKKVGVVGLDELGHMGVKFAHALGAHVVVFTTRMKLPTSTDMRTQTPSFVPSAPGKELHPLAGANSSVQKQYHDPNGTL